MLITPQIAQSNIAPLQITHKQAMFHTSFRLIVKHLKALVEKKHAVHRLGFLVHVDNI